LLGERERKANVSAPRRASYLLTKREAPPMEPLEMKVSSGSSHFREIDIFSTLR